MSGFLLTVAAVIQCPHGGTITASPVSSGELMVQGQAALTEHDVFTVAGCPFVTEDGASPCTTVQWTVASGLVVSGSNVLDQFSVGEALNAEGSAQGSVVIASPGQTVANLT
ncbi:MAG TPA: hypothetical protein VF855_02890 [Acidimicrobiales bacterium]